MIKPITRENVKDWLLLRRQLWPDCSDAEHMAEIELFLSKPRQYAQFIWLNDAGDPIGFSEASIRRDHVNGTRTTPVAFLEGIFVTKVDRRKGIARSLTDAVADWAIRHGMSELASDTDLTNTTSQAVHLALGFEETERVVFFRKSLAKAK